MELESAKKVPLNRITHSVRASQAVLQYGVGAMIDFPNQTLMTAAPEYWREQVVQIHDERLEKVLHVDYFGLPGGQDDPHCREGMADNSSDYIVPVKQQDTNWYPAYEVRGEGIFIEFDESAISKWQDNNPEIQHRVDVLNENYRKSFIGQSRPRRITAKFLLLHTISHALIKQLNLLL